MPKIDYLTWMHAFLFSCYAAILAMVATMVGSFRLRNGAMSPARGVPVGFLSTAGVTGRGGMPWLGVYAPIVLTSPWLRRPLAASGDEGEHTGQTKQSTRLHRCSTILLPVTFAAVWASLFILAALQYSRDPVVGLHGD